MHYTITNPVCGVPPTLQTLPVEIQLLIIRHVTSAEAVTANIPRPYAEIATLDHLTTVSKAFYNLVITSRNKDKDVGVTVFDRSFVQLAREPDLDKFRTRFVSLLNRSQHLKLRFRLLKNTEKTGIVLDELANFKVHPLLNVILDFSRSIFDPTSTITSEQVNNNLPLALRAMRIHGNIRTRLDLSICGLSDADVKNIAETLPETNITELILNKNKFGDVGAGALAETLKEGCTKINTLEMSANSIALAGIEALASAIPKVSDLSCMDLSYNGIYRVRPDSNPDHFFDSRCASALARAIRQCGKLTKLILDGNPIGDEGGGAIVRAILESSITELSVGDTCLTTTGAREIAKILPYATRLQILNVRQNDFFDAGIVAIAAALLGSPSLTALNVSQCSFGRPGLDGLTRGLKNLTTLDVQANEFGEDANSDARFVEAVSDSKLTFLSVDGAQFNEATFAAVRRPGLEISLPQ